MPLLPPPTTITTTPCSPPNRVQSLVLPRRHQCRHIRLHRRQRLSHVRVLPMIRPVTMVSRPLLIFWTLIFQPAGPCRWHQTVVYFSSITTNVKPHGWIHDRVAPALCPIRLVSSKMIWDHCLRAGRSVFTLTVASSLSITVSHKSQIYFKFVHYSHYFDSQTPESRSGKIHACPILALPVKQYLILETISKNTNTLKVNSGSR